MARAERSFKTLYMGTSFATYLDQIAALRGSSFNALALDLMQAGIAAQTQRGALFPGQPKPGQQPTAAQGGKGAQGPHQAPGGLTKQHAGGQGKFNSGGGGRIA